MRKVPDVSYMDGVAEDFQAKWQQDTVSSKYR